LSHVKELRPDLPVVVRTNDDTHVEALKAAGAAEVVAEIIEGSVMLASQVLLMAGVSLNRVIRQIQENRARRYAAFSGFLNAAGKFSETMDVFQPRLASVLLKPSSPAVGKKLRELKLHTLNVEVNTVRRNNQHNARLDMETPLEVGDILVLLGSPEALKKAEKRVQSKEEL
jgi:CPA2 family monovalent cation:H+ antiporter-2